MFGVLIRQDTHTRARTHTLQTHWEDCHLQVKGRGLRNNHPCLQTLWFQTSSLQDGEGNGTPFQYSCLENPMGGGAWKAAVPGVAKSRTRLSDFTFTFHFHALEKEMATHSSVLAWRIPGTGGAWRAAVYGVAQSRTRLKRLSSSSSLQDCEKINCWWSSLTARLPRLWQTLMASLAN